MSATWDERDGSLVRELEFQDFAEAFAFVTRVALVAQARDHHPDITIAWNKVTLVLTTHDAGRTLTQRDRDLAAAVDGLLGRPPR